MFAQAVPGDFGPQTSIEVGQSVDLFVDVEVAGDEDYVGPYSATFYLSEDEELGEEDDIVLAEIFENGTIPLNGSSRLSQTLTIPFVIPGEYFLLLTVDSLPGFGNAGTNIPILRVATDFRAANLNVAEQEIDLEFVEEIDWTSDFVNSGAAAARVEFETVLTRDRKVGNGDDIVLGYDGTTGFDLEGGATTSSSLRQAMAGMDVPSGSYYFGLRLINAADPTPKNNIAITAKPVIALTGNSVTDGVVTMIGGGGLDRIITHDVGAIRANGTGFGQVLESGATKAITYTLRNDGAAPLEILSIEARGQHPGDFTMSAGFATMIAPGSTEDFTITFDPLDFSGRRANFLFTTNDPNRERFRMRIAGGGEAAPAAPDIEVFGRPIGFGETREITNNDRDPELFDGTHFGSLVQGNPGMETVFTIRNAGQTALVFQVSPEPDISIRAHSGDAANGFKFGRTNATTVAHLNGVPATLQPDETFTFRVKFAPTGFGNHKPWLEIYTNDPDESLFRFKIVGFHSP